MEPSTSDAQPSSISFISDSPFSLFLVMYEFSFCFVPS